MKRINIKKNPLIMGWILDGDKSIKTIQSMAKMIGLDVTYHQIRHVEITCGIRTSSMRSYHRIDSDQILELYLQGLTAVQISEITGAHPNRIRIKLRSMGATVMRPRKGHRYMGKISYEDFITRKESCKAKTQCKVYFKNGTRNRWSDQDEDFLKSHRDWSIERLSCYLMRSVPAVRQRLYLIKNRFK